MVIGHQTCKAKATKQKLTGEALVNFVKQCETDAYMDCVQQAEDRKLEPLVTASWIAASPKHWGLVLDGACHTIARTTPIARGAPGVMFAGRGSAGTKSADSKAPARG